MTTDFTQDSVLHYLRKSGGAVKNSDLLLHFRGFLREHADRERNRDLFKKFVNSVATVQQIDGVSHVVLRKNFKGHVPGGGDRGSPRVSAGRTSESSAEKAGQSRAGNAEKTRQKPPQREATAPAAGGVSPGTTILPAAGIVLNNNNNVEANLDLKQKRKPDVRASPAQVNPEKTPSMSRPPAQRLPTQVGQHMGGRSPPPGITPAGHQGETRQPVSVPDPLRGRPAGGLHLETPPPVIPHPQAPKRRHRYRKSYKSAVSCDEDEEEEEPMRRGSTGRAWPVSAPLGDAAKAMSASSPCIINQPASPSASSSPSTELTLPRIYIQNVKEEVLAGGGLQWSSDLGQGEQRPRSGLGPGSVPEESIRRSLPVEAERFMSSSDRVSSQPPAQLVSTQRTDRNQLSSSHGSIFRPSSDTHLCSSERLEAASSRGSGWHKSCEDLQARAGTARGDLKIQEAIQRAQGTKAGSVTHIPDDQTAPWYRSAELLHVEQDRRVHASPWNLSTGDLHDDREDAESSEGSTSSTPLRQRPLALRMSSHLRSRMCRSLGSDLDQFLQEDARVGGVGGNEAARLDRLHRISSSLSLHYNLSSSSLSSCSTPPRCQSMADLVGGFEGRGGRRSFPPGTVSPSTGHHEVASKQSLVPLESREHAWLVKGAAGAWPDIYSLFREDPSLLNRRDFISGFTVLHWIAKHGDHRVLNTLWYGVQKAGLTFDIDARSTCGHTPLHIAAIHNHKNIIRVLVSKFSADGKLRDTAGKKPWQYLSADAAPDVFQMLGAPPPDAGRGEEAAARADSSWKPEKRHHRHRRHHFSTASSGQRPVTISGTTKVKRSSSIAALLKHKSLRRFHGHQSESSI